MSKSFLVRLAATAIVALCVSAVAPRQHRPDHAYASTMQNAKNGVKINTTCGMSGYMVAVG